MTPGEEMPDSLRRRIRTAEAQNIGTAATYEEGRAYACNGRK
jgi:hypothetical protein